LFAKDFYHEWMLDLPDVFSASIEMIMSFLFQSVNIVNYTDFF
jgi:hypothetical protein